MKRFLICLSLCSTFGLTIAFGFEFGGIGNVSAGMGGAGVALKNSPFALYYNPALLSADNKIRFGYSLGLGLREKNIDKVADIDLNNFTSSAERFIGLLGNTNSGDSSANPSDFTGILDSALTSAGGTGSTLSEKFESFKNSSGDWNKLISQIQAQAQNSSLDSASKDLVNNIAGSIDFSNLTIDSNGNIAGIGINFGGDSSMDSAVRDLQTLQSVLQENAFSVTSQNGISFQFAPPILRGTLGTFGVGFFSSFYGTTSIKADPNRMGLILKGGNEYYKVDLSGSGFSYSQTTQTDYEQHSLEYALQQGNVHNLITRAFWINEIPIGYAHTFYFKNMNLNLGISARLMSGSNAQSSLGISTNTNFVSEGKKFISKGTYETKATIAVDLGTMFEIDLPNFRYLTFGFVAKNINTPKFRYTSGEIEIKPQYRIGMAYNQEHFVFAFDADLSKNEMLSDSNSRPFSQMIGGGVKFDIKAFDLRLGLMKDIRQDDGIILTAGVNILGFFDIAVQSGTALGEAQGYRFPRYLNIRVGGNISF